VLGYAVHPVVALVVFVLPPIFYGMTSEGLYRPTRRSALCRHQGAGGGCGVGDEHWIGATSRRHGRLRPLRWCTSPSLVNGVAS
jgi:hypothetical protein